MTRRKYTLDQKAQVLASIRLGNSESYVGKQFGIPEGTVHAWSYDAKPPTERALEQKEAEESLIDRFYNEALTAFIASAQLLQDRAYTRKYSPSENAILFGVLADKWLYLLERGSSARADAS